MPEIIITISFESDNEGLVEAVVDRIRDAARRELSAAGLLPMKFDWEVD